MVVAETACKYSYIPPVLLKIHSSRTLSLQLSEFFQIRGKLFGRCRALRLHTIIVTYAFIHMFLKTHRWVAI